MFTDAGRNKLAMVESGPPRWHRMEPKVDVQMRGVCVRSVFGRGPARRHAPHVVSETHRDPLNHSLSPSLQNVFLISTPNISNVGNRRVMHIERLDLPVM